MAGQRSTFTQWYSALPLPWLVAGPNGQAEALAWPAALDQLAVLLDAARKQAYPDYCAADALPHLGGDRKLVQGASESNANFITRIKTAWGNSPLTTAAAQAGGLPAPQAGGPASGWALAGTHLQLLEQLYWGGFGGDNVSGSLVNAAVIVQQNGLADHLSGIPTAGADNSGLLVIAPTEVLSTALTCGVATPVPQAPIPAGNSWFAFDLNTYLCNRFAIIFPTAPSSYPWNTAALALLKSIILTWRPNSICVGVFVITAGEMWDYPTGLTWDGDSNPWDAPSTVVQVLSQF